MCAKNPFARLIEPTSHVEWQRGYSLGTIDGFAHKAKKRFLSRFSPLALGYESGYAFAESILEDSNGARVL